jgi:hypothetical protein
VFYKRCKFKTQKTTNLSAKIAYEFEAKLFYLTLRPYERLLVDDKSNRRLIVYL